MIRIWLSDREKGRGREDDKPLSQLQDLGLMWFISGIIWRLFPFLCLRLRSGFNGTNCEVNIDDCPDHQCQNGGTCMDGVNTYNCQCPPEWTGTSLFCSVWSVCVSEGGDDWQIHDLCLVKPLLFFWLTFFQVSFARTMWTSAVCSPTHVRTVARAATRPAATPACAWMAGAAWTARRTSTTVLLDPAQLAPPALTASHPSSAAALLERPVSRLQSQIHYTGVKFAIKESNTL